MNRIQDVAVMFTIAVLGMALPLEAQASVTATVPEPATLVMLATGLAGLGAAEFIRRRKKK
jgi:MYXO-CTERM domain-containing protein